MTHRVNIVLDDFAWSALQEIPKGERSKIVSKAISDLAEIERKTRSAKKMDAIRKKITTKVSTSEITDWIRQDRKR